MDHLRIVSSFTNEAWDGYVDLCAPRPANGLPALPAGANTQQKLERAFRLFNRVEVEDGERLESWDYRLPSMSAGDRVELNGVAWQVDAMGFSPDERAANAELRPWPIMVEFNEEVA